MNADRADDLSTISGFHDLNGSDVEFATSGNEVVVTVREAHGEALGEPHRIRLGPAEQDWFARHLFAAIWSAEEGSHE